jgi:hypothetical protein
VAKEVSRATNLVGGYWDTKRVEIPDYEPKELLMPLIDTELKILIYERQADGQYKIKGETKC